VNPVRTATVLTHRRPSETRPAVDALIEIARAAGAVLYVDPEESRKHRLENGRGLEVDVEGFLATVDREEARSGIEQAFAGAFEVLSLPGIAVAGASGDWLAINDVSMHRQPGNRVADLAYAVGQDEIGRVRCDGLAVATPAGSTGYNLANGGPVMAWGVAGFVVSFIAPHSLTARALVVAPTDVLSVHNRSREESVDVTVDGRPVCTLPPGQEIEARFVDGEGCLAQLPGANFYHRLREKFGRLSSMR